MTLSYTKGPTHVPLLSETIGLSLRRTVERFPHREALVAPHQGYRATYAELWAQVDRAARALLAQGVGKGDRVGIWAPNRYEWVVTQFATARVGAILVTINPAYKAAELGYALRKAGVSLLVVASGFRGADYVKTLFEVRPAGVATRCPVHDPMRCLWMTASVALSRTSLKRMMRSRGPGSTSIDRAMPSKPSAVTFS